MSEELLGREQELTVLDSFLGQGRERVLAIQGTGGMGKTFLLEGWLSRIAPTSYLLLDLYDDCPGNIGIRLHKEIEGAGRGLRVLALDGAEAVDEHELDSLLKTILADSRGLSAIVATRNSHSFASASRLVLGPLSDEHALRQLKAGGIGTQDQAIAQKLVRLLRGHPLSISLACGLIGRLPAEEVFQKLAGALYDIEQGRRLGHDRAVAIVRPALVAPTDRMIQRLRERPDEIFRMSPREFERLIAQLLEGMGFKVSLTKQTRDGGVDIIAAKDTEIGRLLCLVEAKKYSPERPVGIEVVRSLYGTFCDREANSALLVTSSRFTKDAHEFASRHRYVLSLREYVDLVRWLREHGSPN